MRPLNHIAPVVVLPEGRATNNWDLAGTGFCFHAPEFIVTAAHCVGNAVIGQIIRAVDIPIRCIKKVI
jgi:hypothetical protein